MAARKCPVPNECTLLKSMNNSSGSPSSLFENQFFDSLANFMVESSRVLDEVHRRTGRRELLMTAEEREARMQELIAKIAEKERELSELEEQRRNMLSNYDASASSGGSGPAFTPPRRSPHLRSASGRSPHSLQENPQEDAPCVPSCDAECTSNTPMHSRHGPSPVQWRQRRAHSTAQRRGTRPPAFDTSGYSSSNAPGDCDPNCTNICNTMDDSTMESWYRRLM